jgi:hypothetical protein
MNTMATSCTHHIVGSGFATYFSSHCFNHTQTLHAAFKCRLTELRVTLQLMVSQLVHLGVETRLGLMTRYYSL